MSDQVTGSNRSHAHCSVRVYREALYRYTGLLFDKAEQEKEVEEKEQVEEEVEEEEGSP